MWHEASLLGIISFLFHLATSNFSSMQRIVSSLMLGLLVNREVEWMYRETAVRTSQVVWKGLRNATKFV